MMRNLTANYFTYGVSVNFKLEDGEKSLRDINFQMYPDFIG
jgi:hypothetical protein